jgi:hypothetical protein
MMRRIKTFNIFEASVEERNFEANKDFYQEWFSSRYGKELSKWVAVKPVGTGKVYLEDPLHIRRESGVNVSGNPRFFKVGNSWAFELGDSRSQYGYTQNASLDMLFKEMIFRLIRSNAPSSFNKKQLDELISNEENIFSPNLPNNIQEIYKKAIGKRTSGIFSDFWKIRDNSDYLKSMDAIKGVQVKIFQPNLLYFGFNEYMVTNKLMEEAIRILHPDDNPNHFVMDNSFNVTFIPEGEGTRIKTRSSSKSRSGERIHTYKVSIGYSTEKEATEAIEDFIKKNLIKIEVVFGVNTVVKKCDEFTEILQDILSLKPEMKLNDFLDEYFKENPLDLHLLDELPTIKEGVLRRTGIKDWSKLGKLSKSGLI